MAVIVTVVVPVVAVDVAENETVTLHVGLHGLFVKFGLTPLGSADVEKVTAVVAPLVKVAVIDEAGLVEPCPTVRLLGEGADKLKLNAAGVTTKLNVAVRVTPPPTAWMVIVVVEPGAIADAVRVTVAEQDGLQLAGVKALAVTPVGSTVIMLKVTAVVTPATRVAIPVSIPPAAPPTIVSDAGVAARLKSNAAGVTTRLKVAVRVTPPPTA